MTQENRVDLRQAALDHLWMHNRDWTELAEEGGPPFFVEGHGVRVVDSDGKTWFDVNGGYASVNVGYGRTEIIVAVREQSEKLAALPQGTTSEVTVRLAEKLAEIAPGDMDRTFFASGGSEAVDTALKMARAYFKRIGEPGRYKVISRRGSYHGAVGGTLWLGGTAAIDRFDYEPVYPGILYAPHPNPYRCELGGETASECAVRCARAIEELIVSHGPETVAAVIGDPVAGSSGNAVPGDEYWPMVRDICDRYGVLLIADEVVTAFGRTGKMFGMQNWDVVPDILATAKGIVSSYMPMAAVIARPKVANAFAGAGDEFQMRFTFSGHPISAAAALANIEVIQREDLPGNAAEMGAYLRERLRDLQAGHRLIGDVRGIGLMNTIEMVIDRETKASLPAALQIQGRLNENFARRGLLLRCVGSFVNMASPLCITREEVDEIVTALDESFQAVERTLP